MRSDQNAETKTRKVKWEEGHLSLTGKAHGRAVTRRWKGAVPERGKSRSQTNATHQMTQKAINTPDRAW